MSPSKMMIFRRKPQGAHVIVTPGSRHTTAPHEATSAIDPRTQAVLERGFPASRYVGDPLRMGVQLTPTLI